MDAHLSFMVLALATTSTSIQRAVLEGRCRVQRWQKW
jgi:hypothetical protein